MNNGIEQFCSNLFGYIEPAFHLIRKSYQQIRFGCNPFLLREGGKGDSKVPQCAKRHCRLSRSRSSGSCLAVHEGRFNKRSKKSMSMRGDGLSNAMCL